MICAQYVICWTGPPVTPTGTTLQLERGVGRHQCCSQPAQVLCVHFNHLVCVPSFFALIPLSFLYFSPVSPTPSLTSSLPPPPSSLPLPPPSPSLLPPPPSLPLSYPPVVMYMYTSRDISGKITHTIYPPSLPPSYLPSPSPPHFPLLHQILQYIVIPTFLA